MATLSKTPRTTQIALSEASSGPFNLSFRLFDTDDVTVYVNGVETDAFTLTAGFKDGYTDTASITLTTAAPASSVVTIDSDLFPWRQDDFINGPNLTQQMNVEAGRLWAAIADVKRDTKRAIRILDEIAPMSETASERANRMLQFALGGNAIEAGPTVAELLADIPKLAVTTKKQYFTLTAGQTVISGLDDDNALLTYGAGMEAVYLNGVRLQPGDDYTRTNDSTITLAVAASAGDVALIEVVRLVSGSLSDFMLRSFDIATAWDVDLTGTDDSATGIRAARNNAISAGVPVLFPAGDYKDGATVYSRTGPCLLLTNTSESGSYAPWRSPQHALRIIWDTGDEAGGDNATPIGIQMQSYAGINADGIRLDHLSEGGVGTGVYVRVASSPESNFLTAHQGETRHQGGATSCANFEAKSFSTLGNTRGLVLKQATGSIQAWNEPHPISGTWPKAHPEPVAALITGTAGATYSNGTPIDGQDDLSGTVVGNEGAWLTGIEMDAGSLRLNGTGVLFDGVEARYGIDLNGMFERDAVALRGNTLSFDEDGSMKVGYGSAAGNVEFSFANTVRVTLNCDSSPSLLMNGVRVITERQAAIADVPTGGSATAAANAEAINAVLAVMRASTGHGLIENS
jgi:hypothetical protein